MAATNSPSPTLLTLPTELRLQILSSCISFPNLISAFALIRERDKDFAAQHSDMGPVVTMPKPSIPTHTPAILLVCKQLTTEALDVLFRTTFVIEPTFPRSYTGKEYFITEFVCLDVLQRIRYAELKLRSLNYFLLLDLTDLWRDDNNLQVLSLRIQEPRTRNLHAGVTEHPQNYGKNSDEPMFEFRLGDVRGDTGAGMRLVEQAEAWIAGWSATADEEFRMLSTENQYWSVETARRFWDTFQKEMVAFLMELCLAPGTLKHRIMTDLTIGDS
jgi:hypothetical protein